MQTPFADAITALSMLDVLKFVPAGQKVVVLSEDTEENLGVVFSKDQIDGFVQECQSLASMPKAHFSNQTPLWNLLVSKNVVALNTTPKGVALENPRSGCSVGMSQEMWASLAKGVQSFELADQHTDFDDAVLVGFLSRIPSQKIQKAFEWCQNKGSDPWSLDKDSNPQWMTIVESMDQMSLPKESVKEVTVVKAPKTTSPKPKR